MSFRINSYRRRSVFPQLSQLNRTKLISLIVTALFFLIVGGTILMAFLFAWYSRDLPSPNKVARTEGFSTIIYDRNGQSLYDIYQDANRVPVDLADVPKYLQQATVAIEDKDFYKHQGFSQKGILRAFLNILFLGRLQGGSTLTQQLVKNVLLTQEQTLPRKIKEVILSSQIERKYTKDEILQMYLNETPYGGPTAGVEKAAEYYFNKHVKDVSLTESIILAGLPQAPSLYSPFVSRDPKAYIWRAEQVARRMQEDGYITDEQEKQIKEELPSVEFTRTDSDMKAPHFVLYVREQLVDKFGEDMVENGGLRVMTTLDWKLQEQAEKIVSEEVDKLKGLKVGNAGAVVINSKTGEILTMVGSKDYTATEGGAFNVVTQAKRQPGSTLKPITYAEAFKKGYTPATLLMDVETHFPGGGQEKDYIPKNYNGKFSGPLQLRFALGNSINVVAVKTQALVGLKDMLTLANEMGLTTLEPTEETMNNLGLSVVLGGGDVHLLDLSSAYGVFATGGIQHEPFSILKVTDRNGKILWEQKPDNGKKVLPDDVAFLISHILLDNNARKDVFGEHSALIVPGKTVSVKTGTTDDLRDNWTVGFTPSIVTGVWVGNNDNSPMNSRLVSGVTGAAPIWNRIMQQALKGKGDEQPAVPSNVVSVEIDAYGGGLPKDGYPKRSEYFIKGTEPTDASPIYKKLKISKSQGDKLANPVEAATGQYDEKEFVIFSENDPVSTDGKNRWQEGIDAWVNGQGDSKFKPPKETSSTSANQVAVSISKPQDKDRIDTNTVHVEAKAAGISDIQKMELEVDGSVRLSVNANRLSEDVALSDGPHTIKVRGYDKEGKSGDSEIRIGVKVDWDVGISDTPTPTKSP